LPTHLIRPVIACSPNPKSSDINRLVLIHFCLARDARGRLAKGSSGNPRGRPRGIPNPKRRVPDLVARRLSAQALSDLIDRKPHLLRPLAAQLLPPPLACIDPAERLGIDLSSLRTVEDFRQVLSTVLAAVSRAERSRPPRARASHGGCLPDCAPFAAAHGWSAGWCIKPLQMSQADPL
jgi:hypothetical protein